MKKISEEYITRLREEREAREDIDEPELHKVPKRWRCLICNKTYCYLNPAIRHNIKKHEGKAKFQDLKELKLKY